MYIEGRGRRRLPGEWAGYLDASITFGSGHDTQLSSSGYKVDIEILSGSRLRQYSHFPTALCKSRRDTSGTSRSRAPYGYHIWQPHPWAIDDPRGVDRFPTKTSPAAFARPRNNTPSNFQTNIFLVEPSEESKLQNSKIMATVQDESISDVPTLAQKHSGIPASLLDQAQAVKKDTFGKRTKLLNERKRLPVIPQGVEKDLFFQALDELRQEIGVDNVDLNDKPLKDGW